MAISQNLEDMKLSELKDLAKQMGLRGTSTMRKSDLVSTLTAARNGGEAPAGVTVRVPANPIRSKQSYSNDFARDSYLSRVDDTRGADTKSEDTKSEENHSFDSAHRMQRHSNDSNDASTRDVNRGSDESSSSDGSRFRDRAAKGRRRREFSRDARIDSRDESKNLNREENRDLARISKKNDDTVSSKDSSVVDLDQILATLPNELDEAQSGSRADSNYDADSRRQRSFQREDSARGDRFQRRMRARTRDFDDTQSIHVDRNLDRSSERDEDRNSERDEDLRDREVRDSHDLRDQREQADRQSSRVEPQEELVPVAGIVDVLESYAFIRTSGYLPGPNDVYVSMSQIKKYGLRKGDAVQGSIRAPRDGDRRSQRQKFVPLQSIDTINGLSVEDAQTRPQFAKLTPLYPQERLKQETTPNRILGRIIDLVAPIGKGQRGLIVSPPKAGKTITLQNIANAIAVNNPEVHLMVVLVDERPEEVTDMERTVQGEVISSTFDRPATDHTTVAELAIERAKRLVELGQDVVVLLDSMTRLARAYNIAAPTSGRILSGGVDAQALYPPKKFFGAARNIENGGSLTIISSALVETGSKMDEVIFEEFKGTGNMELRLSRDLADKRLFPAVDINSSGTRREELITSAQELPIIYRLRRLFGGLEPEQAYQTLVPRLKKTASNRDFLSAIVQQANNSTNGGTAQSAA